jgi:hypothetical protein
MFQSIFGGVVNTFCFRETKDLPDAEQQISNLVTLPVEPTACGKDYIWYPYF